MCGGHCTDVPCWGVIIKDFNVYYGNISQTKKTKSWSIKFFTSFFDLASLRKNVLIGQRPSEVLTPNVAVFNAILDFKLFFDLINNKETSGNSSK